MFVQLITSSEGHYSIIPLVLLYDNDFLSWPQYLQEKAFLESLIFKLHVIQSTLT